MIAASIMGSALATGGGASRGKQAAAGIHPEVRAPGQSAAAPAASLACWAKITGSLTVATNKWKYQWAEVSLDPESDGGFIEVVGGRGSATWGFAYNTIEAFNDGSGVEGTGVDESNLTSGFSMKPIGIGAVVPLVFVPASSGAGAVIALFSVPNAYDGVCSTSGSGAREIGTAILDALLLDADGWPIVGGDGRWLLGAAAEGVAPADLAAVEAFMLDGEGKWLLTADGDFIVFSNADHAVRAVVERIILDQNGGPLLSSGHGLLITE